MSHFKMSEQEVSAFDRDGYVIVKGFLQAAEVDKLAGIALNDNKVRENAMDLNDKTGKKTKLTLWYTPGNDAYGLLTKSRRIIDSVDRLMDGDAPVCHFHSKLMQKEPRVGGAWEWHQDYGYWYKDEFLYPDQLISVMVAITDATKENGCLQVIRGSHKMGRVEHGFAGEQVGASMHYVELALQKMPLEYVEIKAGDALFFHSNLLHRSAANLSDSARWSLISCYNRSSNTPFREISVSCSTPIEAVPDEALLESDAAGIDEHADFSGKHQIHKEK